MKLYIKPVTKYRFSGLLLLLVFSSIHAQQNNQLRGKMLFLSSGKKPAVGVKISGVINQLENANIVYTTSNGEYMLTFQNAKDGHKVDLEIGEDDAKGQHIELVNVREVEHCRIPARAEELFEIIVCLKGARNAVASRYYKIIKTSTELALEKLKREKQKLMEKQEEDDEKIGKLFIKNWEN